MTWVWRRRGSEHVGEICGDELWGEGLRRSFSPYLAQATDAHVQGFCVAPCPIQNFRCKLHNQSHSPGLALQRARVVRVVGHGQPLIQLPLVLDVVVSRALLGTKIACFWWAVLQKRQRRRSAGLFMTASWSIIQLAVFHSCQMERVYVQTKKSDWNSYSYI